jgi:hypothetical protein
MHILLHNSQTGRYYAGDNHWTSRRADAVDLRNVERAIRLNKKEQLGATEVIVAYQHPPCALKLPISDDLPVAA